MARIREDYDQSWWANFQRWLTHGDDRLDRAMAAAYEEQPAKSAAEARAAVESTVRSPEALASDEQEVYAKTHAWQKEKGARLERIAFRVMALMLCVGIIGILIITTSSLPSFGQADNPANNEVSGRYIEQGMAETGAVNMVAGMILDYRAFDTLGESNVLFTAVCAVVLLLRLAAGETGSQARQLAFESEDRQYEPKDDMILRKIAELLVPMVLLFGMYVILNGHLSPGGGFSGGAVMGAGMILCLNAYGFKRMEHVFSFKTFQAVSVTALSFYALSKAYSFFTGANHLPSVITPGTPGRIFSAGLIPYLNIAVGLVVCCTMYGLYTLFRRGEM